MALTISAILRLDSNREDSVASKAATFASNAATLSSRSGGARGFSSLMGDPPFSEPHGQRSYAPVTAPEKGDVFLAIFPVECVKKTVLFEAESTGFASSGLSLRMSRRAVLG